ncbi:MAG: helix-turn-helix domain-containing protein [Opitutales bacterium]
MASIGDRLEEARKRQGISIRDAAEATKIRGDFLLSFENNKFDIDLPEVYRRGFLKNYARYLKLDPERVAADYQALVNANAKGARRGEQPRETYGRMEVTESHPTLGSREAEPPGERHRRSDAGPADPVQAGHSDIALLAKVAGGVAVVVLLGLVVWGIAALVSGTGSSSAAEDDPPASAPASAVLVVKATGDVSTVLVRRTSDRENLFFDSLEAGTESPPITITSEVLVYSTAQEHLEIILGGQTYTMDGAGDGKALFDTSGWVE